MNKSESKYFCTAKKMDEAFLHILEKKNYEYITVKEICNEAGVNRSTFYLHYETMNDLLEETIESVFQNFDEHMSIDSGHFIEKIKVCSVDELYLITPKYLVPYLKYVESNQNIFRVAFLKTKVLNMDAAYQRMMEHVFNPILERYGVPEKERVYLIQFYVNGIMGIIKEWLKNGCEDSAEDVVKMIQRCIVKPRVK